VRAVRDVGSMPTISAGDIVGPTEIGRISAWPGADLRARFVVSPRLVGGGRGTIPIRQVVRPQWPAVSGRTGVRLRIRTSPSSARWGQPRRRPSPRGRPVRIYGRAEGLPPGRRVVLRTTSSRVPRLSTLAVVRTGKRGRFVYRGWKPSERGIYEVWAFTPRQSRRVRDFACPRVLAVK
jgi:hypothetical protein